jgi:potassium-transporting ATPase KdpC subunit
MKTFTHSLKLSFFLLLIFTGLLGIAYPFFMWGVGQLFFHKHANGTILYDEKGQAVGSAWIAQNFTSDKYFHSRPSAAGDNGYDASNSSGSNLGPTSQKLIDSVTQRAADYRQSNGLSPEIAIPGDAVTASGSGLDPHISLTNAKLQLSRVAKARNWSEDEVERFVRKHTQGRTLGIFGEKRVNVLKLNLALDLFLPEPNK